MIDLMLLDSGKARVRLTRGAFPPSSVHLASRIAGDREMLTDHRVDEVFLQGWAL